MVMLSENFTLEELVFSQVAVRYGQTNIPNRAHIENLRALCHHILQPIRNQFGPVRVTSGFRSKSVNALVGGSANSQHCRGEAADIIVNAPRQHVLKWIAETLPFDQLIDEYPPNGWIHVSYSGRNRRETLTINHHGTASTKF